MRDAPFAPLIAGGQALRRRQSRIEQLRRRMSRIYGVDQANILPIRGRDHAFEVAIRFLARSGGTFFAGEDWPALYRLAEIYGVNDAEESEASAHFVKQIQSESAPENRRIVVVDQSEIEFAASADRDDYRGQTGDVIYIRSLELAYGLAGAPCGAIIASAALINRLAIYVEPDAVPPAICEAALAALDPVRVTATKAKTSFVIRERARIAARLAVSSGVVSVREDEGPFVTFLLDDDRAGVACLHEFGVYIERLIDGRLRFPVGTAEENDRLLSAFGATQQARSARSGEAVRETAETRIVATVDLDRDGVCEIETGVGFFDHMLQQIVHHAGISATLACDGDLEIDAHHTVEDCAITFGEALSKALGDRRGIARFGFLLPMDEAEAKISIDLGGRPYLVFDGAFSASLIGAYPTEMTEHFFRSLAQSLGAAIHISVTGENDHHKTEACFKAFGRALRQAVRIESDVTPSTKGAIL